MKLKTLFAAAALVASTQGAFSQTTIRIVASNGDRTATQTAISHLLSLNGNTWTFSGINGHTSSSGALNTATGANYGAWNGTYGGSNVIIKVSYSGALAGIAAVAGNTDQRFVFSSGNGSGANLKNPTAGDAVLGTDYEIAKADFGFSTNFQTTSPFLGVYNGVPYSPLVEETVGISPLGFYASPGFPSGLNITTQLAQYLYTNGSVSLALFTGDFTNDANKIVYAIGRNTDAGQRFGAYTEIGLGTSTAVRVWQPSVTGTASVTTSAGATTYGGTANTHALWPAETFNGISSPLGSGGYPTGATLASTLTTVLGTNAIKGRYTDEEGDFQFLYPNATAAYYIGYLTPGDAVPRVISEIPAINRGVPLSYNGVALHNPDGTVNEANVKGGKYTAWLYNRILKTNSFNTTPSPKLTFANALRNQIRDIDAPSGGGLIDDATVKVKRLTDGGLVRPK